MACLLACRLEHLRNCTAVVSLCHVLFETAFKHGKGSGTSYVGVYKCQERLEMHGIPGVMWGQTCSSCNLFYDGGCCYRNVISHTKTELVALSSDFRWHTSSARTCTHLNEGETHLDQFLGVASPFGSNRGGRDVEKGGFAFSSNCTSQQGLAGSRRAVQQYALHKSRQCSDTALALHRLGTVST